MRAHNTSTQSTHLVGTGNCAFYCAGDFGKLVKHFSLSEVPALAPLPTPNELQMPSAPDFLSSQPAITDLASLTMTGKVRCVERGQFLIFCHMSCLSPSLNWLSKFQDVPY